MFTKKMFFLIVYFTIGLCEAGFNITDTSFQKCSLNDAECHKKAFEIVLQKAKTGIPEFGIPPMDPYELENTTVTIPDTLNLTMTDGKIEGTTNCPFSKFDVDVDSGIITTESFCEQITWSGRYQISVGGLFKKNIGPVSGDGNGKIQIDKMTLKMKIPFSFEKNYGNDDIFLVLNISEAKYSSNNVENITFGADNIIFDNQEISQELIGYMNKDWKNILRTFGKLFSNKIMDVFYFHLQKFFLEVPAKYYISDDLSSYIKT